MSHKANGLEMIGREYVAQTKITTGEAVSARVGAVLAIAIGAPLGTMGWFATVVKCAEHLADLQRTLGPTGVSVSVMTLSTAILVATQTALLISAVRWASRGKGEQ